MSYSLFSYMYCICMDMEFGSTVRLQVCVRQSIHIVHALHYTSITESCNTDTQLRRLLSHSFIILAVLVAWICCCCQSRCRLRCFHNPRAKNKICKNTNDSDEEGHGRRHVLFIDMPWCPYCALLYSKVAAISKKKIPFSLDFSVQTGAAGWVEILYIKVSAGWDKV